MKLLKSFLSLLIGAIFLMPLFVSSCGEQKKYRIGVSQCSDDDWRAKMNGEIMREMLFHENAEVEILSADDDPVKQAQDIRYFADNGFDIIIAAPVESESMTPVIKEVYDRGIPVILFDREINGDSYTAKITADNFGIGKSAARYALQMPGKPMKAIELRGLNGSTPAQGRHEGFVKTFTENGGTIVADSFADWKKENAEEKTLKLLKEHPETQVIYAHNDRMAIGAAEAAAKLGRKDIKIIGIDAAPSIGIKAVLDSVIDATFIYPTEGGRLIRNAIDIIENRPFERNQVLPVTSAVDLSNADILDLQQKTIDEETEKIVLLKGQVEEYWSRHNIQTILFYTMLAFLAMIFVFLFLILKAYWLKKKNQAILEDQNEELQKQRDVQKQLNEQLQEATQSKLMFFTNVSHDLRTPLTLISEPVEQIAKAQNLTDQQHTLIKIADKNVKILKRLINQILDFRKLENGSLKLHLAEFDLAGAVKDWTDTFRGLARQRDIKLKTDIPDSPVMIALDVEKIERIFFNLISNAFKYTSDNGTIRLSLEERDNKVILKISDTGEGISKEDLAHIFDPFFQVDRVRPKGSGIGLSLTKTFVELHEGTLEVESELGQGSEFKVTLPVKHVEKIAEESDFDSSFNQENVIAELEPVASAAQSHDDGLPLLLVIDDNEDILKMIRELLKDKYRIITAKNGKEGINLASKYIPDLIICDMMMPVMDGLECCRLIKDEISTSHIPVLMLTACALDEQRIEGYDSGADGYMSKPFSSALLQSRIDSLLKNRFRIKNLWQAGSIKLSESNDSRTESPRTPVAVTSRSGEIDSDFYRKFLSIFEKQMGNSDLSIEEIAYEMGLGHSQFYRKIKALTNYTPVELMRRLRLERARKLLTTTEKVISEIAYEVGFSTPAYFTKCYRTAFGETPSELRQRLGHS